MESRKQGPEELPVHPAGVDPLVRHVGREAGDPQRLQVDVPHRELRPERHPDNRDERLLLDPLLVPQHLLEEVQGDVGLRRQEEELKDGLR